jgi:hypothetical protein
MNSYGNGFNDGLQSAVDLMQAGATTDEIAAWLARDVWRTRRIIVAVGNYQNRGNRNTDVQGS